MKISKIALLLAVVLLLLCGCDNTDSYHTPYDNVTSGVSSVPAAETLTQTAAPPIIPGRYNMHCVFRQESDYTYEGMTYINSVWDIGSWYSVEVTVSEGKVTAVYTITRRNYSYIYNGQESVIYDTDDSNTRTADTKINFDLIGLGFTAVYGADGVLESIKGADAMYEKCPEARDYLSAENLEAIAQELILSLPETIEKGTQISHCQTVDAESELYMTYTAASLTSAAIRFTMALDGSYGMPETETGDGYTVEYIGGEPYEGTLYIDAENRMNQSSSNTVVYYNSMTIAPGEANSYTLDGTTEVSDTCEVTFVG